MEKINGVVILGAGNVATHLGKALSDAGIRVLQVYSRRLSSARTLAGNLGCPATSNIHDLLPGAGLYLMAVTDDAISGLAAGFPLPGSLLVHTSGTTGMSELLQGSSRAGVFYPLQTFSREVDVDLSNVPICLEAENEQDLMLLGQTASRLSKHVVHVPSPKRKRLHVAAVFACNFVNHMYHVAEQLMQEEDLDFELLRPLIMETALKVMTAAPHQVQTGPASRNNTRVLEAHNRLLAGRPGYRKLYNLLSQSIIGACHEPGNQKS